MGPGEVALRLRKKWYEFRDAKRTQWPQIDFSTSAYPKLPDTSVAPESVRAAVQVDAERIASGQLRIYGYHKVAVDKPPNWHRDYQAVSYTHLRAHETDS